MPRSPLVPCFTCRAVKLGSYHVVHPASLKRVAHRYEATTRRGDPSCGRRSPLQAATPVRTPSKLCRHRASRPPDRCGRVWMALRDTCGTPAREPAADPGGRPVNRELGGTDPALARERDDPACPREDSPLAKDVAASEAGQVILAGRPGAERRRMRVHRSRIRYQRAPGARESEPQDEVDVLPVGEQQLVE